MATCYSSRGLLLLTLVLFTAGFQARGQKPLEIKVEPGINLSLGLNDRWSINSQVKANQLIWGNSQSSFQSSYTERLEFQAFVNYSLFGSRRLSLGYIGGIDDPLLEDPGYEHRLTQQFSFVANSGGLRLAVRIRAEQRFRDSGFQQRYRVRLGTEIPLQGYRLDEGEPYLLLQNELLTTPAKQFFSFDNRADAGIGWLLPRKNKIQFQVQHRLEKFNRPDWGHVFQILAGYFISF